MKLSKLKSIKSVYSKKPFNSNLIIEYQMSKTINVSPT